MSKYIFLALFSLFHVSTDLNWQHVVEVSWLFEHMEDVYLCMQSVISRLRDANDYHLPYKMS